MVFKYNNVLLILFFPDELLLQNIMVQAIFYAQRSIIPGETFNDCRINILIVVLNVMNSPVEFG